MEIIDIILIIILIGLVGKFTVGILAKKQCGDTRCVTICETRSNEPFSVSNNVLDTTVPIVTEYNDYLKSQALEPDLINRHAEFVAERASLNGGDTIMGRTYAIGEIESDNAVPWQGIMGRPQKVPDNGVMANVADIRDGNFANQRKLTWSSGTY